MLVGAVIMGNSLEHLGKPTIKECISWIEHATDNRRFAPATIAFLRDYARVKAMLDDPRVVRVPLGQLKLFAKVAVGGNGSPLITEFEKQVAAWDKERTQ